MKTLRALVYLLGLAAFYLKYVPLVGAFQLALVPILLGAACLTWMDVRRGTLFFVFVFPLINNLPYFFGITEPFPHAPTALVLFLFYFLGYLLHRDPDGGKEGLNKTLTRPLVFFAVIIALSAAITIFRYTNYFPLHGWIVYEIKANTFGVSAGGAIMSAVFQALNYLTGLAFFLVLSKTVRSSKDADEVLRALGFSSLLALGFGVFQYFVNPRLGNNPASYTTGLINGTFKDALSFGAYLSMIAPLFLGVYFSAVDLRRKILSMAIVVLAVIMVLFSGSKIGLFSLLVTTTGMVVWKAVSNIRSRRGSPERTRRKKSLIAGAVIVVALVGGFAVFKEPILSRLSGLKIVERIFNTRKMIWWRARAQWDPAIRMIGDYPLTGVGMGGFIIETANYTEFFKKTESVPESAENYLLQVGSELGLVGLGAVLWVGWALYRKVRKNFRERAGAGGRERPFLVRGAAFGILAFALNAQMHSFIGSYEIKYTLWLLIGVLFALSRGPKDVPASEGAAIGSVEQAKAGVIRFPRRYRPVVAALVLAAFGFLHLWNSTHSLSLQSRSEKLGLVQDFGLYPAEKSPDGEEFRWTREYGAIPMEAGKSELSFSIRAGHPDLARTPVKVRIYLVKDLFRSQRFLREITIGDGEWRKVDLALAEETSATAILLLKIDRTWNPQKETGAPDPRNLGVAVKKAEGLSI